MQKSNHMRLNGENTTEACAPEMELLSVRGKPHQKQPRTNSNSLSSIEAYAVTRYLVKCPHRLMSCLLQDDKF